MQFGTLLFFTVAYKMLEEISLKIVNKWRR